MRSLKTLLVVLLLSTSTVAIAEEKVTAYNDARLSKLQSKLELTDEQLTEMREIREAGGGKKEMRAVMTDEQLEVLKELKQERQEKQQAVTSTTDES